MLTTIDNKVETAFKEVGGLIIEIQAFTDHNAPTKETSINSEGGYFYNAYENKIHKSRGWDHYYFYDENGKAHDDENINKIIAISDNTKHPGLPLLTTADLVRIKPFAYKRD